MGFGIKIVKIRKEEAVIVTKDGKYHFYNYKNEAELERMIDKGN